MKRHIIIVLILIGLVQYAKPQVRLSHTTPVDEIPVEETATLAGLTTQLGYVCEGWYGLDFPGLIELVKRLHAPRWMFHKAVRGVWKEFQANPPPDTASPNDLRVYINKEIRLLELLATCADRYDRALFKTMYRDADIPKELRYWAYFAHLFSATETELPDIIRTVTSQPDFSQDDRRRMYQMIDFAYSFASPVRRAVFKENFLSAVRQEKSAANFFDCDCLLKVFDSDYARSDARKQTIAYFRTLIDPQDKYKDAYASYLDVALNECTNLAVAVKKPYSVSYPPFVSYEESILGEKPNPYRSAIRIAVGSVCVIGLFAGMWVWMRRKRMGRSDPFPHFE